MSDFNAMLQAFRTQFSDIIDRNGNGVDDRLEGGLSDAGDVPTEMADPRRVQAQQPAMNVGRNIVTLGGFDAYQRGDTPGQYLENTARGAIGGAAKSAMFLPEMAQRGAEYVGGRMGIPDLAPNIEREKYTAIDEEFARNPYAGVLGALATPAGFNAAGGAVAQVAPKVITPTTVGGAGAAGAGAVAFSPTATGDNADAMLGLRTQLEKSKGDLKAAEQRRDAMMPKAGRQSTPKSDPQYHTAIGDIASHTATVRALEQQMAEELKRRARMDEDQRFAPGRTAADAAKNEAIRKGTPWEEYYPSLGPAALAASVAVPGALGVAKGMQAQRVINTSAKEAKASIDSARTNYRSNNIEHAAMDLGQAHGAIHGIHNQAGGNAALNFFAHPVMGGIEGGIIGNLGTELNLVSLPDYNPNRLGAERALEKLHPDDPERAAYEAQLNGPNPLPLTNQRKDAAIKGFTDNWKQRIAMPAVGGASATMMGMQLGKMANRSADFPNVGQMEEDVRLLGNAFSPEGQQATRALITDRLKTLKLEGKAPPPRPIYNDPGTMPKRVQAAATPQPTPIGGPQGGGGGQPQLPPPIPPTPIQGPNAGPQTPIQPKPMTAGNLGDEMDVPQRVEALRRHFKAKGRDVPEAELVRWAEGWHRQSVRSGSPSAPKHHSHVQVRDEGGHFDGPPMPTK